MRPIPTLRQLHYLVTVVETRHFGRAADACFVTQSTLAGIQELEELLGVALLERSKRHVLPTPIGLQIAAEAQEALRIANDIVALAGAAREPLSGPLRLGVIPTIGPFVLPAALAELRDRHPNLRLYLREDQTARLLDQLADGQLDAVLMALPWPTPEFESLSLAEDRFYVAFPKDHRFSAGTGPLDIDALRPPAISPEDLLLLEEGHCMRQHALAACDLADGGKGRSFQATSLYTLVQMVANGIGITLLPAIALGSDTMRRVEIGIRPLAGERASRDIGLVWRAKSPRREEYRQLGKILAGGMDRPAIQQLKPVQ
jgi:LysR family hydrogen peroxide-inducible transcriptional activator